MHEKKIMVIFGTRPEAIKLAPVIRELATRDMEYSVCVTAQHRELLDQVIKIFDIPVDFDLEVMRPDQDLFSLSRRTLEGIGTLLSERKPDFVLVQGDTTSSFISSLAAFYLQIPVGHVEAGLRTHSLYSPFPEEANRRLITALATRHYCPTDLARHRLLAENISPSRIVVTGNTVIDALQMILGQVKDIALEEHFPRVDFTRKVLLVTSHRREKFGGIFENICRALNYIAEERNDVEMIYPVHPNPKIQIPAYRLLQGSRHIHLTEPLDYLIFLALMKNSYCILTDSGGLQEEAPCLSVPVLVMRDDTERPEGIEAGASQLIGVEVDGIVQGTCRLLDDQTVYEKMRTAPNPFGDGTARKKIVTDLMSFLDSSP